MASHEIVDFATLSPQIQEMLAKSKDVMKFAYCKYSNFQVGSAVITSSGKIYTGVNVENMSYGLGLCAERTAIVKALSDGDGVITHVAVCGILPEADAFLPPCGACRQFIIKYSRPDTLVYLTRPDLSAPIQDILRRSKEAMKLAYCKYSNFQVGSAIITGSGKVYTGVNVENISYGLTICAERTAIVKAVSEGETSITHVGVCGNLPDPEAFLPPCGACRQFIAEFSRPDTLIYLTRPDLNQVLIININDLLPLNFTTLK